MTSYVLKVLTRKRRLVAALAMLVTAVICLGVILNGHAASASSEQATVQARDMALINGCITTFADSTQVTLDKPVTAVTASLETSLDSEFEAGLAQTATKDFAAQYGALHDPAAFLEEDIADKELGMPLVYERRLVSNEVRKVLANGDVVIWATWWTGSKKSRDFDAATGVAKSSYSIDNLPVIEYVLTKADGTWRIANLIYVDFGPDADLDQYGPDTPHGHEYNPEVENILGMK